MEHDFIPKYYSRYGESGFLAQNETTQIFHRHLCLVSANNLDILFAYAQTLCQIGDG